jgi:hypothetical protein
MAPSCRDVSRDGSAGVGSWRNLIIAAAILSFALKLTLATNTYGTNDVLFWEGDLAKIRADGGSALYREGAPIFVNGVLARVEPFNQPPFMIYARRLGGAIADYSGIPLRFWVRFGCSLADIGSLALVWKILAASGLSMRPLAILLLAISPVSIMISGFHGNSDPIMVFWLLFSIYLIESGRRSWLAGAAFGMALNIKIVPLIFVPVFLLYLPTRRDRIHLTIGAGAIFVAGSLPYLAQEPLVIMHRVFGYSSVAATWGVSQVIYLLLPLSPYLAYRKIGKGLALAILVLAAWQMNERRSKQSLFLQCGCIAFLFLFWTPGFGAQYLAWLLPWGAALKGRRILIHYFASGVFLVAFYTMWSRGLPWFLANLMDNNVPLSARVWVAALGGACWIATGAVALEFYRSAALHPSGSADPNFSSAIGVEERTPA